MQNRAFRAVPLGYPPLQRVGDGHAHGKKKQGEHNVGQAHSVFQGGIVFHPVRYVEHFPEFVHENHQGHGQAPEHVNGKISFVHDRFFTSFRMTAYCSE